MRSTRDSDEEVTTRTTHFTRGDEIAETATSGVMHHLSAGQPEVAAALQPFAAAAWGVVYEDHDHETLAEAHREARRALGRLEQVCGGRPARRFLRDAIAFLGAALATGADGEEA